jgi:hypothetical protein
MKSKKTLKNEIRKEIKNELFKNVTKNPLTPEEFKMYVNQLYYIDDIQTMFKNQRRASVSNNIIKNDELFPEIQRLRRIENDAEDNKNTDESFKTKVAKLIKEALVRQLNLAFERRGEETRVDIKNVEEYVYDIASQKYDEDKSSQVFEMFEVDRLKDVEKYMKDNLPIYKWCEEVRGLGTKLAGKILAGIGDIQRFPNPASLWSYCGVGDAAKSKRQKGQQLNFSPKMRSTLYNLEESFIKANSQYRVIYDKRKENTLRTHPEWHNLNPDGTPNEGKNMHPKHAHNDAARVMIKRFLAELFVAWYQSLGIEPPAKPYGVEIQGHHEDPMIVPYVGKRGIIEIDLNKE